MSRIGKMPIAVPAGVDVQVAPDNTVTVKGPNGTLTQKFVTCLSINVGKEEIVIERHNEEKETKALHGLTRSLLNNMVVGVTDGYKKVLEVNGVGYRAAKEGKTLVMNLGYSHQVKVDEVEGIKVEVPAPNQIVISGADKQQVGQFAAEVRKKRPPEPYKGKGIKYADEVIIRKEGKAGKAAK